MKFRLIVLSLSPLFILTFVQYFPWNNIGKVFSNLNNLEMIKNHICLFIGMLVCVLWIVASLVIYFQFKYYSNYNVTEGYEVKDIKEEKEAGLNFFLTLILPLLVNDIKEVNGLLMMLVIIVIIISLLLKTDLYYQNPILAMLNYHIYRFKFVSNSNYQGDKEFIGIGFNKVDGSNTIEYKVIDENVMLIKQKGR